MREPLLSIIVVSYENPSLILRRALESVLAQSYRNYEIILVDANPVGSDYSLGLREDMEKYPEIPVIACPCARGEFAAAKNAGAAQANGTYIAFLMASDAWNQECAASQIEVLEEHPDVALVFCHSWTQQEDALSDQYRNAPALEASEFKNGLLDQNAIRSVSQVMFRSGAFEDMLGFDTHIHRQDDYDMWIRLSRKYRIASVDQNLVCSYVDRDVLRKTHKLIDVVGYLQLYSKHYDMYKRNPVNRLELYRRIAACYKSEKYYLAWFRYAIRIKVLEMRIGKKSETVAVEQKTTPVYDVISQDKEYIAVVKYLEEGSGNLGIPEAGAEFQIFLKSAGSYEDARANERDLLVCDEDGYARSKGLSQGVYIVRQVKGSAGNGLAEDFEVALERKGRTHTVAVRTPARSYYVKVLHRDAETEKTLLLAGGAYQIIDAQGNAVSMTVTYPEPMELDSFAANEKGYFVTPGKLPAGRYGVIQQQAPRGYVRSDRKVAFVVSPEHTVEENGLSVVTVVMDNTAQKGRILLHSSGPLRGRVRREENDLKDSAGYPLGGTYRYVPEFSEGSASGGIYEVVADEDILTADGTLRLSRGTVAATLTTDSDGDAVSEELYLGRYVVREKKAPAGLLRNRDTQEFEFHYDENGTADTQVSLSFTGKRQKGIVHLKKTLGAGQKTFGFDSREELKKFALGLFAAEEIHLSGEESIPKDGLLEILWCDEEGNAASTVDLPYGSYYVRELAVSGHYRCSEIRYPVIFAPGDQDTSEEVHLYVNDGNPIVSEMIRGTVCGTLIDPAHQPVSMAEIGLFAMDTEEFVGENASLVAVTDWNGMFSFKDIPCGDYIVKEIRAAAGYARNEAMYFVSLTFDEQRIDLRLISQPQRGEEWSYED